MMRAIVIAMVAWSARSAAAECVKKPAAIFEIARKATVANDKRYDAAVAKAKLAPVELPVHRAAAGEQLSASPKPDAIATVGAHRLVAETSLADCRPVKPAFGRRGDKIYRLHRAPHAKSTRRFTICSCYGGTRCGGIPKPTSAVSWYELPDGVAFSGVLDVAYDSDDVEIVGAAGPCPSPP